MKKDEVKSALLLMYNDIDEIAELGLSGKISLEDPSVRAAFEELICDNAYHAITYAKRNKKRFKLGEPAIAKDENHAYLYALIIVKGRWELGEPAIAKDEYTALQYAVRILGQRFELGEETISKNGFYAYLYAKNVLKGRFILGEEAISKHSDYNDRYYQEFIRPGAYRMIGAITAGGIIIIATLSTFFAVVSSI